MKIEVIVKRRRQETRGLKHNDTHGVPAVRCLASTGTAAKPIISLIWLQPQEGKVSSNLNQNINLVSYGKMHNNIRDSNTDQRRIQINRTVYVCMNLGSSIRTLHQNRRERLSRDSRETGNTTVEDEESPISA